MCTSLLSQLIIKTLKPVFTITCVSICFICFGQCLALFSTIVNWNHEWWKPKWLWCWQKLWQWWLWGWNFPPNNDDQIWMMMMKMVVKVVMKMMMKMVVMAMWSMFAMFQDSSGRDMKSAQNTPSRQVAIFFKYEIFTERPFLPGCHHHQTNRYYWYSFSSKSARPWKNMKAVNSKRWSTYAQPRAPPNNNNNIIIIIYNKMIII